jgi:Na+-transporting methylmalonyl-CoA/oxaloacetate decarboxylase gamma subunit
MTTMAYPVLAVAESSFWAQVNYQLVGFLIVLITLAGLWICLEIIGVFFKAQARQQAAAAAAAQPAASPSDVTDAELFAVIAAAIDTAISQPHQIVSISSSSPAGSGQSNWGSEGRRDIYRTRTLR